MEKVVQDSYNFTFNFSDSNNELVFVDEPELADRPWQRETEENWKALRYR